MVEQFGLAIILDEELSTEALTSGTTSGISLCIRQHEELSITVVPSSANLGAHSPETAEPAEKSAKEGFCLTASSNELTFKASFLNFKVLPTDFSDATGINSVTGKFLCSKTLSIT